MSKKTARTVNINLALPGYFLDVLALEPLSAVKQVFPLSWTVAAVGRGSR